MTKFKTYLTNANIFIVLSLAGAAFNYLLYPALTRILKPAEFGDFTVVMAIFNQVLSIMLAFNIISISLVKNHQEEAARTNAQAIQKVLLWFFMALSLIVLVATPLLQSGLKVNQPLNFFVLCLLLLSSVPAIIWSGYLQGHKRLLNVGIYSLASSIAKVLFAVILATTFGVFGGLSGVLAGVIVGTVILQKSSPIQLPHMKELFRPLSTSDKTFLSDTRYHIITALLVVGSLGVLQNIDITFAKLLFDPQVAGIYSGVSILSNAIYYLAFLLVWILLPEIEIDRHKRNRQLLVKSYRILAIVAVIAVGGSIVSKQLIIRYLLGTEFISNSNLLVPATLFQLSLVGVVMYAFYLLVVRDIRSLVLALSVTIPCLIAPLIFGSSPIRMITSLLLAIPFGLVFYVIIGKMIVIKRAHGSK